MRELGGKEGAGFSWSSVAKRLGGGRTGKSCRLRYTLAELRAPGTPGIGYMCSDQPALTAAIGITQTRATCMPAISILPCAMQVVQPAVS